MRYLRFVSLATVLLALGGAPIRAGVLIGDIAVYNSSGTTQLGYVSTVYDGQNSFTYSANIANALSVQITTPISAPFSIDELNPPQSNHYFGAVGGTGGYSFSPTNPGYAYLSGTGLTAAGATPTNTTTDIQSLGYNGPAESTIWSVSGQTFLPQWVNSDSTTHAAVVFYDPVVNFLGITSDLSGFNAAYSDGATQVLLEFTTAIPTTTSVPEPGPVTLAAIGFAGLATIKLLRHRGNRKRKEKSR